MAEDFKDKYPDHPDNIAAKWDFFYNVVKDILSEEITDDSLRVEFNKLDKPNVSKGKGNSFLLNEGNLLNKKDYNMKLFGKD